MVPSLLPPYFEIEIEMPTYLVRLRNRLGDGNTYLPEVIER